MNIGKVRCGLEELVALFLTTSEAEHNRMMTGLHRHRYIHGSLLHQALFSADGISTSMLSIKTGAFCKTNWRGKNERWCYVELLEVHEATDRVILTMDSLPEEIGAGLDATKYARPLTNVRMVCVLDKAEDLAPGKGLVDVACYAEFRAVSKDSAVEVTKSMKRRLLALCKMSSNIQHVSTR
ncbi:TPA: hypothetical protein N0F65_008042 [Lagenidium giganteum]|uniref:Uncharacterized protein n=1 Tax=Lagenidium giganteum TaxID=4803 RepID=A0AAV2YNG7_9STRA|nr:TPA: hypothetical protein N0F65_008042 [Lagenidium giganteum]